MKREQLEVECAKTQYFANVKQMKVDEAFMFVQADTVTQIPGWYPLRMQLDLQYWQRDICSYFTGVCEQKKELVSAKLKLRDYHRPAVTLRGHEYDLRITFVPITWLSVLDGFALSDSTYILFYGGIDAALVIVVSLVWGAFRLASRQTNPPQLHFLDWLKGFEMHPVLGFLAIVFPILAACVFVRFTMADMDPLAIVDGDMKHVGQVDDEVASRWQHGRVGICILALGMSLMQEGSKLLCPRKDMPGSIWLPGYWQRRHVMYTSVFLFVVLLLALEFSFSTLYKLYPLYFLLLFKVVWMVMEVGLLRALTEKLIALPFECALQTVQYVMTLGAAGFIAFITANILETTMMIFKRLALDPLKFRMIRLVKLRLKIQAAQRAGTAVPVQTPELEVLRSSMLRTPQQLHVYSLISHQRPCLRRRLAS